MILQCKNEPDAFNKNNQLIAPEFLRSDKILSKFREIKKTLEILISLRNRNFGHFLELKKRAVETMNFFWSKNGYFWSKMGFHDFILSSAFFVEILEWLKDGLSLP